jgi:alginate O-acetyltransferase complex protein AlgI
MIFNEFRFLALFLPAVLIAFFFLVPVSRRRELLLFFSLMYYGFSGIEHLLVLMAGLVWVYFFCRTGSITNNGWQLAVAIIGPASGLVYYKYSGFLLASVLQLSDDGAVQTFSVFKNILLPAGISFFTFQMISFAIDRYRGTIAEIPSFRSFALYVSFFPQLVAGPILRFDQVSGPIANLARFVPTRRNIADAMAYIVFGMMIKVLLADSLSRIMAPTIVDPAALNIDGSTYVLLGYSFQIYFDFYGYSLIAIGLGRLFGFDFPDNFLRPYEANNPREFWRRWHVSLSYWIRDYLYIPLGGNRRYSLNIAITFAVCGLWHGAGWNFVVWGLYHGFLVAGYSKIAPLWDRLPVFLQRIFNFSLVSLGWLLFLFDFDGAQALFLSLTGYGTGTMASPNAGSWLLLTLAAIVCFGFNFEKIIAGNWSKPKPAAAYGAALGVIFFVTLLFIDVSQTFIYFRF